MQRTFKTIATLSVLGTLMSCAQMARPPATLSPGPMTGPKGQTSNTGVPVRIAGAPALPPAASSAEVVYVQGRAMHGQGQLAQASRHYGLVLRLDPRHVGALNALGVIHAQDGRTDEALLLFARAIELAPEAPHLYNNAGYALLRADRLDEAGVQLQNAQQLSPGSTQTQQNLALLAQARRNAAAEQAQTTSTNVAQVVPPGARLVAVAPQIYELQTSAPQQALQLAKVLQTVAVAQHQSAGETLRGVRLEVSNGVGTANLARRTADRLADNGVVTARLTNAPPYRQMKTEIQFGAGQDALAKALQTRLPLAATTTPTARLQGNVQLRLLLGRDMTGRSLAAWLDGRDAQTATLRASVSTGGGWMWG